MSGNDRDAGPLLFVYGTLMSHADNEFAGMLAEHARKLGGGTFQGKMYRIHHPDGTWQYPAVVVSDEASDLVHGEIYQLSSAELFETLDDYEACGPNSPQPHEYRRQMVQVRDANDQPLRAHIYLYARCTDGLEVIPEGRFDPPGAGF
jgi:gamma-glutamylcyclotransferase (GGCT)/AIG2-like uncharacterized protein YtfP